LGIVKMFLVAEEDDLVFQEKLVDGRHRCIRKVSAEADTPDFGADAASQRPDIGLGNDLIDENWIAHGNLLVILEEDGKSHAPSEASAGRSKISLSKSTGRWNDIIYEIHR
jgi:hypothetical protein